MLQTLPEQSMWSKPEHSLSQVQQSHMKEIYEFLSSTDDSWSLGRDHMTTLFSLVLDQEKGCAVCALQLLSGLVLKEDIVQMMSHDKTSKLPNVLHSVDSMSDKDKMEGMKLVSQSHVWFSPYNNT